MMAEAGSASAFDPVKEFPNIVWSFDNLPEPEVEVEAEAKDDGLITAPPTPPAPASAPAAAAPVAEISSQSPLPQPKSPTVSKSTPAKHNSLVTQSSSCMKKAKLGKSKAKKDGRDRKSGAPPAPAPQPPADGKSRIERRIAKNLARKTLKRERRKQKREAARSKGGDAAQVASKSDVAVEGEGNLPVVQD